MALCDVCGDSRHVQTAAGWVRCACLGKILDATYIKPAIRGAATEVPAAVAAQPPYPLADLAVGGARDYLPLFKFRVWRSLSAYRDQGLRYDYMDAARFLDIFFDRDEDYPGGLRQVARLPLLVLVLGMADMPNKLQNPAIAQVLTLRRESALPTWVFAPFDGVRVRAQYGGEVADLVGPIRPVMAGVLVPETAPVDVQTPANPRRGRVVSPGTQPRVKPS
jgi:hypothetical protein